ncbi:MAG: hypothetical protein AAF235_02650 [Planctomycetota bacterium]
MADDNSQPAANQSSPMQPSDNAVANLVDNAAVYTALVRLANRNLVKSDERDDRTQFKDMFARFGVNLTEDEIIGHDGSTFTMETPQQALAFSLGLYMIAIRHAFESWAAAVFTKLSARSVLMPRTLMFWVIHQWDHVSGPKVGRCYGFGNNPLPECSESSLPATNDEKQPDGQAMSVFDSDPSPVASFNRSVRRRDDWYN